MMANAAQRLAFALGILVSSTTFGQPYPTKPIRLVAPYPAGGGLDAIARIAGAGLSESLGQQVIVDNRAGASGQIGTETVARAPADGYTLLLGSIAPNVLIPIASSKVPYDTLKDFAPISLVGKSYYLLTVHPSMPIRSVGDLIKLARTKPDQILYASSGNFGGPHMAGELFNHLAKVSLRHVPFRGAGPAMISVITGETSVFFGSGPTVVPQAKIGKLRLIATTEKDRSKLLPDLPTVSETLNGFEVTQWYGLLAPAATPEEILSQLNKAAVKALTDPKLIQRFDNLGASTTPTTPRQLADYIKTETTRWTGVIKSANLVFQ